MSLGRVLLLDQDRVSLIALTALAVFVEGVGIANGHGDWLDVLPFAVALLVLGLVAELVGLPSWLYKLGAWYRRPLIGRPPPIARQRRRRR